MDWDLYSHYYKCCGNNFNQDKNYKTMSMAEPNDKVELSR